MARLTDQSDPAKAIDAGRARCTARVLALDRVLVVGAVDDVASVKAIARCGGVFGGIRDTTFGPARRYWIEL